MGLPPLHHFYFLAKVKDLLSFAQIIAVSKEMCFWRCGRRHSRFLAPLLAGIQICLYDIRLYVPY